MIFTEDQAGERLNCDRSNYNEPGDLKLDVYTAWPLRTRQMIGRVPIYHGWAASADGYTIPLAYRIELDGRTIQEGQFDGWILGRGEIRLDLEKGSRLAFYVKQGERYDETGNPVVTPQGIFWGEICLRLQDGTVMNVGEYIRAGGKYKCDNLDMGCGIGRDYQNGRVTIVGTEYPSAIPASPVDHERESRLEFDLTGLGAAELTACIGVDAYPGDEQQKRKTYAVRSRGRIGRFLTVIEPYESESVISRVSADNPDTVRIVHKDGSVREITIEDIETDTPKIAGKWLKH